MIYILKKLTSTIKQDMYNKYNQGTLGFLAYVNFTIALLTNAIKFFNKT
jgi:hypothetical protein